MTAAAPALPDLIATLGSFASTDFTLEPASERGREFFARHFGLGAVSATLRKSAAAALDDALAAERLRLDLRYEAPDEIACHECGEAMQRDHGAPYTRCDACGALIVEAQS